MRYLYLHGFASGPLSKKGVRFERALGDRGLELERLDLNVPSFSALSVRAMVDAVAAAAHGDEVTLLGSSLGGWTAARFAELHPAGVRRLFLMCPAFDLCGRWPHMLPDGAMDEWRRRGALVFADGAGVAQPVHYRFYEECCEEPAYPDVRCPTLIVHGTRDDRVPVESSRRYAAAREHVRLVEVDDGHDLLATLEPIVERAIDFLGLR